jgi:hypothetical protein
MTTAMARKDQENRHRKQPVDPDEYGDLDDAPRHHGRVDPGERDEYEEWRQERQRRGRKKRREHGDDRRYRQDEDLL